LGEYHSRHHGLERVAESDSLGVERMRLPYFRDGLCKQWDRLRQLLRAIAFSEQHPVSFHARSGHSTTQVQQRRWDKQCLHAPSLQQYLRRWVRLALYADGL
jgi:hypothetical protein